jgi:NADH-ubiquinone oxidoreductase chain 5
MEGPTPVSALIHAATMVTAGIFLIIRCSLFFECSQFSLFFLTLVGSLTSLLGATSALFQQDIKKVIAYSTCSQLGYMVISCGLSRYDIAFFHLINHAFFKAVLFLSAGIIIHSLLGEQDMRRMGGLKNFFLLTYILMLLSSLALSGIPYLAGYYSKEMILNFSFISNSTIGLIGYLSGILSAIFTSFYSAKLLYLVFCANPKGIRKVYFSFKPAGILPMLSVSILSVASIFSGFFLKDMLIGPYSNFFDGLLFIPFDKNFLLDTEQFYLQNYS